MAYQINRYNSSLLTVVEDGTIDQTTDIKLVGKNFAGYGEIQNENFLYLLENFANNTSPPNPISGQLWYDANRSKLKFYDGVRWRTTGGAEVTEDEPVGLTEGDFWWDTVNEQLFAYNGSSFVLVGPQSIGEGITEIQSQTVLDRGKTPHEILVSIVNGEVVYIISSDPEFFIDDTPDNTIPGFDVIKPGLTLINTRNATGGVTSTEHVYWGTASNSLKLGGDDADNFLKKDNAAFESVVSFSDLGFTLGNSADLKVHVPDGTGNKINFVNQIGDTIFFGAKGIEGTKNTIRIKPSSVLPGVTKVEEPNENLYVVRNIDIGSEETPFSNIYSNSFIGISTVSESVLEPASELNRTLDKQENPNTIALRDASGDLRANLFAGTALTARYADLAERYTSRDVLPIGTVVSICIHEDHEVCSANYNDDVIGVVSKNPGFILNNDTSGQPIALKGKTPVRIIGSVNKGNRIYSHDKGMASKDGQGSLVGIALETSNNESEKLINCFLKV